MLRTWKKRRFSLGIALLVSLLLLGIAQGEEVINLLPNPSFEELTDGGRPLGWTEFHPWGTGASVSIDETIAHTGNRSVKIHCPSDGDRGTAGLFIQVVPGMTYQFSGWCRTEGITELRTNVGPVARFSLLQEKDDPKAQITLYAQGKGTSDWELVETSFTVPQGINWIRLDLFMLFQQGTVWWDDVEFSLVAAEDLDSIPNLFPNPSFEEIIDGRPAGWGSYNWGTQGQVSIDQTTAHSGSASVKISCPSDSDRGAVDYRLPVTPGTTYRIRAWYKTEGVTENRSGSGPLARVTFYPDDKATSGPNIMMEVDASSDWQLFERIFMIPDEVYSMRVDFFMFYQEGTVWWDDVSLQVMPTAEVPKDDDNLLTDPSFESVGIVWWELASWGTGARVSIDDTHSRQGNQSVKIVCDSDTQRGSACLFIPVQPGKTYAFSGWYDLEAEGETVGIQGPVARFSLLENRSDPSAKETIYGFSPYLGDWTQVTQTVCIPEGINWIRLDLFNMYAVGTVWWDDVSLRELPESDIPRGGAAAAREQALQIKKQALENALQLRAEALALWEQSKATDPERFELLKNILSVQVQNSRSRQQRVGSAKGKFGNDLDEWQYRTTATYVFAFAVAYAMPGTQQYQNPLILGQIVDGLDFLANQLTPEGRWHTYDTNVDRFTLLPLLEAVILIADKVPEEKFVDWLAMILQACEYQHRNFYYRPMPWGGGYPNMDAYYAALMALAGRLTENEVWSETAKTKVTQIGRRLAEDGGYEYVLGWNPVPVYQEIVVVCLGRYYQLTGDPQVVEQFHRAKDYYKYFVESSGIMDNGMSPHIKHYWSDSVDLAMAGAEIVATLTNDPYSKLISSQKLSVDNLVSMNNLQFLAYSLYWLNDVEPAESLPRDFLRESPSIVGFQQRKNGNWTTYITGRISANDTFVSAIASSDDGAKVDAALEGVVFEVRDENDYVYYFGDMEPQIQQFFDGNIAVQRVNTALHAIGKNIEYPTTVVVVNNEIQGFEWGVWTGGSPHTAPWQVEQLWVLYDGLLIGSHNVTATRNGTGKYMRMYLPIYKGGTPQVTEDGKILQLTYNSMHLLFTDLAGDWRLEPTGGKKGPVITDASGNLRQWQAGDQYRVNMVVGRQGDPAQFKATVNQQVRFLESAEIQAILLTGGKEDYLVVSNPQKEDTAFSLQLPNSIQKLIQLDNGEKSIVLSPGQPFTQSIEAETIQVYRVE